MMRGSRRWWLRCAGLRWAGGAGSLGRCGKGQSLGHSLAQCSFNRYVSSP